MALRIKDGKYGARLTEIQAIVCMVLVVDQVLTERGIRYELSSGLEGEHMRASLHFVGHANDWKLFNVSKEVGADVRQEIGQRLGQDFDVLFDPDKSVIHVEWQPKTPIGRIV